MGFGAGQGLQGARYTSQARFALLAFEGMPLDHKLNPLSDKVGDGQAFPFGDGVQAFHLGIREPDGYLVSLSLRCRNAPFDLSLLHA